MLTRKRLAIKSKVIQTEALILMEAAVIALHKSLIRSSGSSSPILNLTKRPEKSAFGRIRSGYEIESIGSFRRAFSKASDVKFGPLSNMVRELKMKSIEEIYQGYLVNC